MKTMPPPYIDRGEPLPRSSAENRIVALVRSPEHIYLSWDVETEVRVAGNPQVIRVCDLSTKGEYDLEPPADADNWYLHVTPNRTYRFELFEKRGAQLRRLATSQEVTTPVRWAGESGQCVPAEIIQASRHPISRKAGAAMRIARAPRADRAPAAARTGAAGDAPPATHASRAAEAPEAATVAKDTPPAPIPAPRERVFAADYAGGK